MLNVFPSISCSQKEGPRGSTGIPLSIILHLCSSSLGPAASASLVSSAALHSFSATTAALGHVLWMRFVESIYSPHTQASPPKTNFFWSFVPGGYYTSVVSYLITRGWDDIIQHHLKTRPAHRNVAPSQTSEVVGRVTKNCNSYPDAIFKRHQ